MTRYRSAARDEATRLNAQADSWAVRARTNLQRSTNQVLGVVMFAAALFVAGRSTKLDAARLRMAMPAIGIAVFVATLAWIVTSPVSVLV